MNLRKKKMPLPFSFDAWTPGTLIQYLSTFQKTEKKNYAWVFLLSTLCILAR
jgi:hypothetical protein